MIHSQLQEPEAAHPIIQQLPSVDAGLEHKTAGSNQANRVRSASSDYGDNPSTHGRIPSRDCILHLVYAILLPTEELRRTRTIHGILRIRHLRVTQTLVRVYPLIRCINLHPLIVLVVPKRRDLGPVVKQLDSVDEYFTLI